MDLIVYHNNCPDGFTAAYIAKLKYPEAELVPRDHSNEKPDIERFRGKDVLSVDINLRGVNDQVAAIAKSYRVFDHHKSETEIMDKPYAVFDLKRSGAGITWDELFGLDSNRPWLVDYVEDYDLWLFKLPYSRQVNAFIKSHNYSIKNWDELANMDVGEAIEKGELLLQQTHRNESEIAQQALYGTLNGHSTAVVNAPYIFASGVGEILYQNYDIAAIWFERSDGKLQISLRSNNKVDVGQLASQYPGGGGHKNAAGIVMSVPEGRVFVDKILGRHISQEQVNALLDSTSAYMHQGGA